MYNKKYKKAVCLNKITIKKQVFLFESYDLKKSCKDLKKNAKNS